MAYDRFSFMVTLQAIGLAITPILFYLLVTKDDTLVTSVTLIVVWIVQIIYLLYYVRKTNREIAGFLNSVVYRDTSLKYDEEKSGRSFKQLYHAFNEVFRTIHEAKIEKEAEHHYFQNTIKHVGIGLISFDKQGTIELFNQAASDLLGIKSVRKVSDLNQVNPELDELLQQVRPQNPELVKIQVGGETFQLSVNAVEFKIEKKNIRLVSIQDISSEIEAGEVTAWQKLIRVLIHEMTNSISPINLLSNTLLNLFRPGGNTILAQELDQKVIDDSITGLQAINKRSRGLKKFIESYSLFTKIPEPNFSSFSIQALFNNLSVLFKDEPKEIQLKSNITPSGLSLYADEKMVEQVLINLISNSIYFLKKRKGAMIELSANKEKGRTVIRVSDNGPGIEKEEMENIFVPFYSTKEGGSGIGLSLSKQIMLLHKGGINVNSKPGTRTDFILTF